MMTTNQPRYAAEVQHELFVLSHRNLYVHGLGQIILSAIVAWESWNIVARGVLLAWIGWGLLTVIAVVAGLWLFRVPARAPHPGRMSLTHWRWAHPIILTMIGISWGGSAFLMVREAPIHNLMLMISFAGVLAYSALSNGPNDPVGFGVSATLGMAMIMARMPEIFGQQGWFIGGMCVIYLSVLVLAARNARITLLQSIELRLDNEALARTNAENAARAEQANRDKSAFLAAASHDLRQPVHALLLLIEAYRQEVPSAASHPLMQHITAAGQSIRSLFSALMELSRLESGTEKPELIVCDLRGVIRQALDHARPEAQEKDLQVREFVSRRLSWHIITTDKIMLERVLANLLSNAVKYSSNGGILLSLRPAHGGAGLWLEVWDTGVGIEPDHHDRIFDPYVQIGNRERDRSKGLGLGLAIVRDTIRLLGISLTLQSRPGRGSCFRLLLPNSLAHREASQNLIAPKRAPMVPNPRLHERRVLLIDDDPMVQQAMQALLRGWSIDLRCAMVGDETVFDVCADGWEPECVLSDFRLPGSLDGIALLDLILERFPKAVGILQTGELALSVQARAEEAGYLVLFKPVDVNILASTLTAVLERCIKQRATT